ncbi:MAG: Phosphoribosylformylglycinamidine synthase 1 [Candidatus Daviesbacteria bacterium GW2011_GWA1_41_61]|uniref:Phosphoribosylformylglycinamidine synthase 1 n=1 Tax=Candidatus Daviesbacteria bacterium GW2011_GWA2_40_9 TaxID=1618424 RepID=A0A0G0X6F9_9BACT|nr:MAG: Phosphoribosylformylglycinamidine synthase 1 [Candidatus Daviesbacteria bacterium GW2011_GWC1_40_9]KKR83212.1 MAG: Phosphoribosylformylglycinamidine synthase 1 [Candidatus Daviesbacteria bacterium GW2011_GWA2_40_9]KKR93557.1 MAG: Phosphoribosylformylglycinamidine synthase 1 [Candidatus Daviesbacteria bacterium GW2011_GWB1_41_15]KKS14892.1 MAG: Phosphoribosylformylglycinamidine synthase 1 [Candidatus Daviesbacteria bacterium GW2011_GWA1_41_61]
MAIQEVRVGFIEKDIRGGEQPLEVVVVRYPGSNCDFDTLKFFHRGGHNARFLWHKDTIVPKADLLVLCGGFAFGDREYERATGEYRMNPGARALKSPVMEVIDQWAKDERPILGICNGFQILCHAGLLPGKLEHNERGKFFCDDVDVAVEGRSFFNSPDLSGNVYPINIAHGYGRYEVTAEEYAGLMANKQVFLRYQGFNPNGSVENIAGVCNKDGNIWAMMPHPERIVSLETKRVFLEAIKKYVRS